MGEQCIYKLKIDSFFKQLIPPLPTEGLLCLEESIIRDGCRDPLLVWNSTIPDGHNRYEICTSLTLTIPSWISSINRTRSASDFNDVTDNACRKQLKTLIYIKSTP